MTKIIGFIACEILALYVFFGLFSLLDGGFDAWWYLPTMIVAVLVMICVMIVIFILFFDLDIY